MISMYARNVAQSTLSGNIWKVQALSITEIPGIVHMNVGERQFDVVGECPEKYVEYKTTIDKGPGSMDVFMIHLSL